MHTKQMLHELRSTLSDARATTHVLHCLLERVGSLGVRSFADLRQEAQLELGGLPWPCRRCSCRSMPSATEWGCGR